MGWGGEECFGVGMGVVGRGRLRRGGLGRCGVGFLCGVLV